MPSTRAELHYLPASVAEPATYLLNEPPPGVPRQNFETEAQPCEVADARAVQETIDLDRWGFCLAPHASAANLADDGEITAVFYAEARDLVAKVTGASRVIVFDHAARKRESREAAGPVNKVHADYTEATARALFEGVLREEAAALAGRRFCQVNLWRSVGQPVLDAPMALCAAWSAAPEDLVRWQLRFREASGEMYLAHYREGHRWFYFPVMREDEVLVIKNYDSDATMASYTLHSAFVDPATPDDAPARHSIELRALAIY
jgi:hypothetical protein